MRAYPFLSSATRPLALGLGLFALACANSNGPGTEDGCAGAAPSSFHRCCSEAWTDIANSASNCGGCGIACSDGRTCEAGVCRLANPSDAGRADAPPSTGACTPACSSSQECCGAQCVSARGVQLGSDGREDPSFMNCRSCGSACDATKANACSTLQGSTQPSCNCGVFPGCTGGEQCLETFAGNFACVNLQNDPLHCGSLTTQCADGEACVNGMCSCGGSGNRCEAGTACCAGACIDTQTDDANCGTCGTACDAGLHCGAGQCLCGGQMCARATVPAGAEALGALFAMCDEICCNDQCVAPSAAHCGSCTTTCGAGEACSLDQTAVSAAILAEALGLPIDLGGDLMSCSASDPDAGTGLDCSQLNDALNGGFGGGGFGGGGLPF
jgi:Stigma-specific protein, Stig1